MKNYTHQPLIFNNFKSNDTTANNNKSCDMSIYEINSNNIFNNSSVFQSTLVPSTHTEWIIGYNYLNDETTFYCIGPVTKKRMYELNKFDTYFEVCSEV